MRKSLLLFLTCLGLIINGCAPSKTIVDTSCSGYRSTEFSRSEIRPKKIAILPVLGGDDREQFRRPMGDRLHHYMASEFGQGNVRSTQQVIASLNQVGLSEDYSRALNNYQHSGIIPGELIKKVGEALGVEFLLYTRLLAARESDIIHTGTSSKRVDVDELYVQTQIWSTKLGDVVWEGKGGIAHLRRTQADIVDLTAKGLVVVLGNPSNEGPCERPTDLIQSVQQSHNNSYMAISLVTILFAIIILYL